MPGQHDTTPIQTVIYKPNEHADEYIVAIDDVAEVGPSFYPLTIPSSSSSPLYSPRVCRPPLTYSTSSGRLISLSPFLDSSVNSLL
jgi:hypothetical protein